MKNINAKFSFLSELIFMSAFLIAIIFLLVNFYPYPYYLIGSLEGGAVYDGEPDYFANIISTILNGHSMDFLHPGIPLNYLSAISLDFLPENLSTEKIIHISRAVILFINGILIYVGSRLVLKQELICTFALYAVLFIFPAGFFLLDNLSPNSILFGLSVLTVAVGSLVQRNISINMALFSFLLGLALAVKYIAIVLAIPLAASLVFDGVSRSAQEHHLFKIFSFMILITGISFSIFSWPMLPFLPYIFTHHGFIFTDFEIFMQSNGFIALAFLSIIASITLIVSLYSALIHLALSNLYRNVCIFLLICFSIIFLVQLMSVESLMSLGYSLRNFLPILGMIVLFIPAILKNTFNSSGQYYIGVSLLLFLFVGLKLSFNIDTSQKASNLEKEFSSFLQKYDHYDFLVFYPPSSFVSKDIFIAWADYRYGESRQLFSEQNIPMKLSERQKKLRILNSRKFHLESPEQKFSYKYFDYITKNQFFSNAHREVALNQMNLLQPKVLCKELFDGFDMLKSSMIFFPASMNSYITNNYSVHDDNETIEYISNLKLALENQCNAKSQLAETFFNQQKFYLLTINPLGKIVG